MSDFETHPIGTADRIEQLEAALKDIANKSDDCYTSELWLIHGIALGVEDD